MRIMCLKQEGKGITVDVETLDDVLKMVCAPPAGNLHVSISKKSGVAAIWGSSPGKEVNQRARLLIAAAGIHLPAPPKGDVLILSKEDLNALIDAEPKPTVSLEDFVSFMDAREKAKSVMCN